jgi:hypothetical protein
MDGLRADLNPTFGMSDLGLLHHCLRIEIWQESNFIFMSQAKYTWEIIEKFHMTG